MNHAKWIAHFKRNRANRPEPDWDSPVEFRQGIPPALISSIEQFRLGDGGGPASLIAYDRERCGPSWICGLPRKRNMRDCSAAP
jgi:hypothetical protein